LQRRRAVRGEILDQRGGEGRGLALFGGVFLCLAGLPRRRLVLGTNQATADKEIAVMIDADDGPGIGFRLVGPKFVAFGKLLDLPLNFP
jgi:hypothetical protein